MLSKISTNFTSSSPSAELTDRTVFALALAAMLAASAVVRASAAPQPPAALYTVSQAATGNREYASNCAACHGARLDGGAGPALSGRALRLLAKDTRLTVGDMFAVLAKQMPLNEPASLKREQYVAIMAYILSRNGYPAGTKALTYGGALRSNVPMTAHGK
jgi:alcohol dehydrogenase (cytochrome c)